MVFLEWMALSVHFHLLAQQSNIIWSGKSAQCPVQLSFKLKLHVSWFQVWLSMLNFYSSHISIERQLAIEVSF
jgi:hypothetical protein